MGVHLTTTLLKKSVVVEDTPVTKLVETVLLCTRPRRCTLQTGHVNLMTTIRQEVVEDTPVTKLVKTVLLCTRPKRCILQTGHVNLITPIQQEVLQLMKVKTRKKFQINTYLKTI